MSIPYSDKGKVVKHYDFRLHFRIGVRNALDIEPFVVGESNREECTLILDVPWWSSTHHNLIKELARDIGMRVTHWQTTITTSKPGPMQETVTHLDVRYTLSPDNYH
jgi:hypothetical protein